MLITTADDSIETLAGDITDCPPSSPTHPKPPTLKVTGKRHYQQTDVDYDPASKTLWTVMKPMGVPCCNQNMVEEFHHSFQQLQASHGEVLHEEEWHPVHFSVVASRHPTVFNLGGDLALFLTLIRSRDRDALDHYAQLCVNTIFMRATNFNAPLVTISLVQGDAMGGSFEFALSSDVIIAEQGARMGLPEVMFNLFPGMGAYSFLERRIGQRAAETLLTSGRIYSAAEMLELGVIDEIAPDGAGEAAIAALIKRRSRARNGLAALAATRRRVHGLDFAELLDVVTIWVDAALRLTVRDLKLMQRLVSRQNGLNDPQQVH